MKGWITSAFDESCMVLGKQQQETKQLKLKTHKSDELFKRPLANSINQRQTQTNSDLLLSERHEPKIRNDLCVNKSKIDELSAYLDVRLQRVASNASILLLTGPPGCGKYVTLKVLCNEKHCQLAEWNSYVLKLENIDVSQYDDPFASEYTHEYQESQMKQFEQFLFKSSRYTTDQIFLNESNESSSRRVLFIKEIPNSAYYDTKGFQSLLRKFVKFGRCLLVFSFNTSINTQWNSNPAKLFTNELRNELRIHEIAFNSFANTYMIKALQRILSLEKFESVDKEILNELSTMSGGDLRFAINSLEFYFTRRSRPVQLKKSSKLTKKSSDTYYKTNTKDLNFSLFRGLGKILHRKNAEKPSEEALRAEKRVTNSQLQRKPLNSQPEDIFDKIPLSSESLMLFLNQNYLDMYVEKSCVDLSRTFDDLVSISGAFVLSDLLQSSSRKNGHQSSEASIQTSREFASLITMRQMLFNSSTDGDKSDAVSASKGTWKPLYKPYHFKVNDIIRTKKQDAIHLFLHNSTLFETISCQQNEFFQIYLPYFMMLYSMKNQSIVFNKLLNFEQKQFLNQMLTQFKSNLKVKLNAGSTTNGVACTGSMRIGQNDTFEQDVIDNHVSQSQETNLKLSQTQVTKNNLYSYEDLNNIDINDNIQF